jgi:hypothetical protein
MIVHASNLNFIIFILFNVEARGFGPLTLCVPRRCSTGLS